MADICFNNCGHLSQLWRINAFKGEMELLIIEALTRIFISVQFLFFLLPSSQRTGDGDRDRGGGEYIEKNATLETMQEFRLESGNYEGGAGLTTRRLRFCCELRGPFPPNISSHENAVKEEIGVIHGLDRIFFHYIFVKCCPSARAIDTHQPGEI